ncbi:MAG: peroxiredoxin family protein [bacterium]
MRNKAIILVCIMVSLHCSRGNAPDFRLEDIHHRRFYLNEHTGKRVVIVFWATWCKVCKHYLNALENINSELQKKDITMVSIVIDPENSDTLRELLNTSIHVSYPILLDREGTVMEKFNITAVPTTIIIGPENEIIMNKAGYALSSITQIQSTLNLLSEHEK